MEAGPAGCPGNCGGGEGGLDGDVAGGWEDRTDAD